MVIDARHPKDADSLPDQTRQIAHDVAQTGVVQVAGATADDQPGVLAERRGQSTLAEQRLDD